MKGEFVKACLPSIFSNKLRSEFLLIHGPGRELACPHFMNAVQEPIE